MIEEKKATHVASTAQFRYKRFSVKPTTTEQRYVRIPMPEEKKRRMKL
jgi:hypothetical protein